MPNWTIATYNASASFRPAWTADAMVAGSASAVLEVLDEIREWIWLSYGSQIQQKLRRDRVTSKSAVPSNLDEQDVPFLGQQLKRALIAWAN